MPTFARLFGVLRIGFGVSTVAVLALTSVGLASAQVGERAGEGAARAALALLLEEGVLTHDVVLAPQRGLDLASTRSSHDLLQRLAVTLGMEVVSEPPAADFVCDVGDATVAICRYAASQPVAQVLVSDAGEGSASVTVRIFRLGPMPTRVRESGAYGIGSRTVLDLEMSHSAADGWVVADRTHLNTAVVGEVGTGAPPRR